MVFTATMLEPFTEAVVLATIGSASLKYLIGFRPWLFFLVHFVLWLQVDLDVYCSLAGHPLPASLRWEFLAGWAAREVLALPIFLLAVFGDEVVWRGRKYRVLRNGEVKQAGEAAEVGAVMRWIRRIRTPKHYERLHASDGSVSI